MTGSIELDPDGQSLQIRFPYRPDLVERVKTLPGRRWDRGQKMWRVPRDQVENVVAMFLSHGFQMTSDVSSLLAGTGGAALAEAVVEETKTEEDEGKPSALSVSALNLQIQASLREAFPQPVWVIGEILDYDKAKGRDHVFFALVEKLPFGDRIAAKAPVALFASKMELLKARMAQSDGEIELRDGLQVRLLVRVDVYPQGGRYQLILEDIDPSFTLGKMALTRDQILRELRQAGLADRNMALALPCPALRVGVLASPDSDGWVDFQKHLERTSFAFEVTCYPIKVQGDLLEWTAIKGLAWFSERAEQFDVLCILRGGGSRSDLAWFDNKRVATAVAQHELKIVCGIGHERDRSVLDEITHSEKTPTAVAGLLVQQAQAEAERLRERGQRLTAAVDNRFDSEHRRLTNTAQLLRRKLEGRLVSERRDLFASTRRLDLGVQNLLADRQGQLRRDADRLAYVARRRLADTKSWLETQTARQRLLDPRRVLERGYALARDEKGQILTSIQKIESGSRLDIQFRDGRARTRVEETEHHETES